MASQVAFWAYLVAVQASCFAALILQLVGIQVPHGVVAAFLLKLLRTRFGTAAGSNQVLDAGTAVKQVIYLSNHRSWGDFWTDAALLGGPAFISRALVAAGIPYTALWGASSGWLWFFARGAKHKEGAVAWMKNFLSERIRGFSGKGVVIYPEGTRSLMPEGLPLKLGGICAAYELQWPVQVVITTNKESVTAERDFAVNFGTRCVSSVSQIIDPKHFESMEQFLEMVKEVWRKTWQQAYSPDFQMRSEACLPGVQKPKIYFSLAGSWRLQLARLLFLSLLTMLLRRLYLRRAGSRGPQGASPIADESEKRQSNGLSMARPG